LITSVATITIPILPVTAPHATFPAAQVAQPAPTTPTPVQHPVPNLIRAGSLYPIGYWSYTRVLTT